MPSDRAESPSVLLVTGGSRGIGAEIVTGPASRGWAVAFSYERDADAAGRLEDAVRAAGGTALATRGDVADPDAVSGGL